jgi:hypothetical protein
MLRALPHWLLAIALVGATPAACALAGGIVKVRLFSADAKVDTEGTATLQGQNLNGHLIGNGTDVVLTGLVEKRSVRVDVVGRIVPSCGMSRQFMGGIDVDEGEDTSIVMTFQCSSKAGNFGGGEDYQFHLDLGLPSHPLDAPSPSDPGESASLE